MKKILASAAAALVLPIANAANPPEMKEGLWTIHTQSIDNPGNKKSEGTYSLCRSHAYDLAIQGVSCTDGAIVDSSTTLPITLSGNQDVTSQVGGDQAEEISVKSTQFEGVLIGVKAGTGLVTFEFLDAIGTDTSTAPDPVAIAKQAMAKITAASAS